MKPLLLDLFCGGGGCSMGYYQAGFRVEGVDLYPQPHYPFRFFLQEALSFLEENGHRYDAIHASPPCQGYSRTQALQGNSHPLLISPLRDLLISIGRPYIIENVADSPLRHALHLTGPMFGLGVLRRRLFECSFPVPNPIVPLAPAPVTPLGRRPTGNQLSSVVGHFVGVKRARRDMEISWMTRDELAEAVPPAYTRYIGTHLLSYLHP